MHMPKVLYIIADGGRVRFVKRLDAAHFTTFRKFVSAHMHEKAGELTRDRPGRVRESATTSRHAIEPKCNPRDKVEEKFIEEVAHDLCADRTINDFDHLVLVAPARLLKVLRASLSADPLSKLIECIDKDLTKIPDIDLADHLPLHVIPQTVS